MLLNAFSIYIKGPGAYEVCRKFLLLPSIRSLRRLSSGLRPGEVLNNDDHSYLKSQVQLLSEKERIVSLKLDEVSLTPSLEFQGEQVMGYAQNTKSPKLANSCQAFMISSFFSKYQDIVKLIPVKCQTAVQLKKSLFSVLSMLFDVGYTVIAITSDNHSTNRALFFDICGGDSKLDTRDREHKFFSFNFRGVIIHCFFDGPHMWKCVRNNWINLVNEGKVFFTQITPN